MSFNFLFQNLHDDKRPRIFPSQSNINAPLKDGCNNSSNHSEGKKDSLAVSLSDLFYRIEECEKNLL